MKKLFLAAVVMLGFAACTNDATEDVIVDVPETLTVSFEESSRVQLQNDKTVWSVGDLVSVFYRSDANQQWKFQGKTGDRTGTLKRVSTPQATEKLSKVVVVYPYNENYYINPETCNIQAFMPAEQTYLEDSYGLDGNIMISQSEYNQFSLKNVCGWLKIQLKGDGQVVQKITLKGNNGEQVAGELYIDSADATATLATEMGGAADDAVGGSLVFEDAILTEVTLNCPDGVTLGSEATAFYIALPPQEFSNGFNIKVTYADDTTMTKSTTNKIVIERNVIQPMDALYYDGNLPPVYELAYTTNDGKPLDPYTTEGFGSDFVENIYDATTGCGSLKFSGKITTIPEKAFIACTNLTKIELSKDVTNINTEAFSGCRALTVMNIPQSVKTIGNKAFYNCSGMTEITIAASVASIGTSSFEGCGGKANINCKISNSSSYGDGDFYKAKFIEVIIGHSVTEIGDYAFVECNSLTSITIPDSVTSIGGGAFERCTSLTSVTIPNSVTSIDNSAFYECSSLSSVTIPNSVTSIGHYAFAYCTTLASFTIPDSITSIKTAAFYNCDSLKEIYYSGELSDWCKIDIGNFDANPMSNGAKLYINDIELTEATIPSDITDVKDYTFQGCTSLTSVTFHKRVTSIGEFAFGDCPSLTSVTIPDSITLIESSTFSYCTSLKEVYYTGDLSAWCKINFGNNNANPMSNGAKLYLNGVELTEATIPSDITDIKYTFTGCTSLMSVTIGKRVTSIGEYAFYGCNRLCSVTLGNSVTEIGERAFCDCSSLTNVTIPDSVSSIAKYAFLDCNSLKDVYCKPTTPPSGDSNMFSYYSSGYYKPIGCTIYVPRESVDAYKAAYRWSEYKSSFVAYDFE